MAVGKENTTLSFADRMKIGEIALVGTGKPITVVLKLICDDKVYENRYLFLTNNGSPESKERREDINAVVDFFSQV